MILLTWLGLVFAGLLAGEEIAICYGVRQPLGALNGAIQISFRQSLILRLRILVPALFMPALVLAIIVAATGFDLWRGAAVLALVVWAAATFLGTVPINKAALDWQPTAPPANWRERVELWERLDVVRCWAAVVAFALLAWAGVAL